MAPKGKNADSQQKPAADEALSKAETPAEPVPEKPKRTRAKKTPVVTEKTVVDEPAPVADSEEQEAIAQSFDTPDFIVKASKTPKSKRKKKKKRQKGRDRPGRHPIGKGPYGRHPQAKRPTVADEAIIADRRGLVWGLTKAKKTVRQISAYLKSKNYPASIGTIQSDRDWCFENARTEVIKDAGDELTMALAILDDLHGASYPLALKGDIEASKEVRAVLKERDRLVQFSKAEQEASKMKAALINFLGFDPEAPTDDDDDSDGAV